MCFYGSRPRMTPLMDLALSQLDGLNRELSTRSEPVTREPAYSYRADESDLCIQVELPGVAPADLHVHAEPGKILIKGSRFPISASATVVEPVPDSATETAHDAASNGNEKEVPMKTQPDDAPTSTPDVVFAKEFNTTTAVDTDAIRATFKYGLLDIVIPRKSQHTSRRITVNA